MAKHPRQLGDHLPVVLRAYSHDATKSLNSAAEDTGEGDGYYYGASQDFASMFAPVLSEVRKLSSKPVLISEASATAKAGQAAKIADLFKGASVNKLVAVIWFDMKSNQDWQLSTPAALSAFRTAADKYGVGKSQ